MHMYIFDIRNTSIVIAAALGGFIPAIITSIIIGLFRLLYFGISSSSIIAMLICILMGIGCPIIISKTKKPIRKWTYSAMYCSAWVTLTYIVFVPEKILLVKLVLAY